MFASKAFGFSNQNSQNVGAGIGNNNNEKASSKGMSLRPRTALTDISNKNGKTNATGLVAAGKSKITATTSSSLSVHTDSEFSQSVTLRSTTASTSTASQENKNSSRNSNEDSSMTMMVDPIPLDEVDLDDVQKPRYCSIYVNDVFRYFRESERKYAPPADYMSKQEDLNDRMRAMLINWMVEVHHKFKLVPQTMYLTVNYLDRFLSRKAISRKRLQLAGCTAMLIASKYEEIYAPEAADFVYVSDNSFTRNELLQMESTMLATLDFNLTFPSGYIFLGRFIKVADCDSKTRLLATYLLEQTLQDYPMLAYGPSMTAAAALLLAMRSLSSMDHERDTGDFESSPSSSLSSSSSSSLWTPLLVKHTTYSEKDLEQCVDDIKAAVKTSERRSLRAIHKKYSTEEFLAVSKIQVN